MDSAYCVLRDGAPQQWDKQANSDVLIRLRRHWAVDRDLLAIEMIASYGMPVGREVFETCLWIGRYIEAWEARGGRYQLVYRKDVKMFLCESMRAKDANIRAALIDRFGGKDRAIGKKSAPGPLYGMIGDCWSALAVALKAAAA